MDFLGVGPLELVFIILIALIVLGPKDMVKAGRTLGRFMRGVITSPTWRVVQTTSRSLRKLPTQLMRDAGIEEIQAELKNEMDDVNRTGKALGEGLRQDIERTRQELNFPAWTSPPPPSILPPQAAVEDAQPAAAEPEDSNNPAQDMPDHA